MYILIFPSTIWGKKCTLYLENYGICVYTHKHTHTHKIGLSRFYSLTNYYYLQVMGAISIWTFFTVVISVLLDDGCPFLTARLSLLRLF